MSVDALRIHETCKDNQDWDITILPNNKGIFIGVNPDLNAIINLLCEDEEIEDLEE
jgi:hypothetical protein